MIEIIKNVQKMNLFKDLFSPEFQMLALCVFYLNRNFYNIDKYLKKLLRTGIENQN